MMFLHGLGVGIFALMMCDDEDSGGECGDREEEIWVSLNGEGEVLGKG